MSDEAKIEAVLFWKGEPITRKNLCSILGIESAQLSDALETLKENLKARGIVLLEQDDKVTLGTAPELTQLIENLQKEELNRDLSKASLETLSIVLYKNGAYRAFIDYVRGVNSSFTLRALSVRGLIEKTPDSKDGRRYIYKPTFELLSYLGIKSVVELPDYTEVNRSLDTAADNLREDEKKESESMPENL